MSAMRVRVLPVLYPCAGCAQWGDAARETTRLLERQGAGEMSALDDPGLAKARARFPIVAIDACGAACARLWLERRGAAPDAGYVLLCDELQDPARAAARIRAQLRA